jgi:hypothetical protein
MSKISVLVAALALAFSCGPSRHSPGGDDGSGPDGGNVDPGSGFGSSCATSTMTAMSTPLDIYVMLDQSGSMDLNMKWDDVSMALDSFVQQPNLAGVSVGIQYFALQTPTGDDDCTVADYAKPEVEIAPLPGVASAIVGSIASHDSVVTEELSATPTYQGISGAVSHAKSWATSHPGDTVVVVFATDGEPGSTCGSNTSITPSENVAKAGYTGTPKIPTFVIGVQDSSGNLANLNGLASAGGTGSAYIVNAGGSAQQQFLDALNQIRGNALGCTYQIPTGSDVDPTEVNITYTPGGGGQAQVIPQVASMAACPATGNAWYYDNPAAPTEIILCSATCGTIQADTTGSVGITLGCHTVIQ